MANLLLSGATGMVGRELLARAAADERFERVFCLVRPSKGASAQDRLDDLLRKLELAPGKRLVAVKGDVVQEGLGLSPDDRRRLEGVTHVIHSAATVTFDLPLHEARKINVDGTKELLGFARELARLERFDSISTAYVGGKRDDLVMEDELEHRKGFHNTYEQTKHEAEKVLRATMAELPIAVHRPSIVVGDSRTGKTGAYKVLYWPLKVIARGWLPVIPYDPDGTLDIVPVDFVADAVMALSRQKKTIGGTFHLTAGPGRDTTMEEITARVFARFDKKPPVRVKPSRFRAVIRPLLKLAPSAGIRRTLDSGLVYRPYLELRLRFDTSKADRWLTKAGVRCPKVTDYIDTIVDAAIRTDFGKKSGEA